jgi:hypothetical protein
MADWFIRPLLSLEYLEDHIDLVEAVLKYARYYFSLNPKGTLLRVTKSEFIMCCLSAS